VSAEHDYDRAPVARGGCQGSHDVPEITRNKDIGEGGDEGGKAAVLAGGRRKFVCRNLVRAPFDWNGANLREIGLLDISGPAILVLLLFPRPLGRTGAAVTAYGFGDGK
jgi:hypothetical protein